MFHNRRPPSRLIGNETESLLGGEGKRSGYSPIYIILGLGIVAAIAMGIAGLAVAVSANSKERSLVIETQTTAPTPVPRECGCNLPDFPDQSARSPDIRLRTITAFPIVDPLDVELSVPTTHIDYNIPKALIAARDWLRLAREEIKNVQIPLPGGGVLTGTGTQTIRIATNPLVDYFHLLGANDAARKATMIRWAEWGNDAVNLFAFGPWLNGDVPRNTSLAHFMADLHNKKFVLSSAICANETTIYRDNIETVIDYWEKTAETGFTEAENGIIHSSVLFGCSSNYRPGGPLFPTAYASSDGNYVHFVNGVKTTVATGGRAFAFGIQNPDFALAAVKDPNKSQREKEILYKKFMGDAYDAYHAAGLAMESLGTYAPTFLGLDTTLVPVKEISTANIIEKLSGAPVGSTGTINAVRLFTTWNQELEKEVATRPNFRTTGFRGMFIPIGEDDLWAKRNDQGLCDPDNHPRITLQLALTYSAICGTGIDAIGVPGNTTREQYRRMTLDMSAQAIRLDKPLTIRVSPVKGKTVGECALFPRYADFTPHGILDPDQ